MPRFQFLLPALLLSCFLPAPRGHAQDAVYQPALQAKDIDAGLGTDWYGLYLKDKKIGYCKTVRTRTDDAIVDSLDLNMKIASFDKKVEIKITRSLSFANKPPYPLIAGTYMQDDGGSKTVVTAKRQKDGFDLTISTGGKERTRKVADLGCTLASELGTESWLRSNPKVGDKVTTKSIDLKDWEESKTTNQLKAIKSALVRGVEIKYSEVESESEKDKVKFLTRYQANGKALSSNFAVFELRQEPEDQAKNTEFSQDLFVLGMVKIDRKIGSTTQLTELVIEVTGPEGDILKNGPLQTVTLAKDGKTRLLKLGKKHANETKLTDKDIEENLAETAAYVISDAKVKALALEAIKGAKTPEEKATQIVAFAHRYIHPQAVATLPNIETLLKTKTGDCKCYSLLVANLCRAAGLPCREVAGLVYMGDDTTAFGGHAWNEIAINGVWVPVDATLNQMSLDAGHISLGDFRTASGQLLNAAGKLSFKAMESQTSK